MGICVWGAKRVCRGWSDGLLATAYPQRLLSMEVFCVCFLDRDESAHTVKEVFCKGCEKDS